MPRTGRTLDEYLATYLEGALPEEKEAFEAHVQKYALANELIERRKAKGLTQVGLAELTGVQQSEISRMERGEANPTLGTLSKVARGLGLRLTFVDDSADSALAKH